MSKIPRLYLAEWLAGGCIMCGKNERGQYNMAHQMCWPNRDQPLADRIIEQAQEYLDDQQSKPKKTPEQLRAELVELSKSLMGEW